MAIGKVLETARAFPIVRIVSVLIEGFALAARSYSRVIVELTLVTFPGSPFVPVVESTKRFTLTSSLILSTLQKVPNPITAT